MRGPGTGVLWPEHSLHADTPLGKSRRIHQRARWAWFQNQKEGPGAPPALWLLPQTQLPAQGESTPKPPASRKWASWTFALRKFCVHSTLGVVVRGQWEGAPDSAVGSLPTKWLASPRWAHLQCDLSDLAPTLSPLAGHPEAALLSLPSVSAW